MNKKLLMLTIIVFFVFSIISAEGNIRKNIEKVEKGLLGKVIIKNGKTWTLKERMKYYKVPGLSIAVIKDFNIEWSKGYGVMDVGTKEPVSEKTLFQAASISKPVASMGALKKVMEGKLSMYENINNKLQSWKLGNNKFTDKKKVTLKHLMSHTAGVTVHGFRGYISTEKAPTLVQLLNGENPANSALIEVDINVGRRQRYAGGGYCVMQQVMIDIEKKNFPQIMKETVLTPIGMINSSYKQPLDPGMLKRASAGHRRGGELIKGKRNTYPEMAAAGLWTTAEDLAKFAIELQLSYKGRSNKVLSQELTEEMLSPFISKSSGLGIFFRNKKNAVYFTHGGANEGFRCQLIAHRDDGYGVVVMTNSDNGSSLAAEIIRSVANVYKWKSYLPEQIVTIKMSPDKLSYFQGKYAEHEDEFYTVAVNQGKLYIKSINLQKAELLPISENTFIDSKYGVRFTFSGKSGERISQLFVDYRGKRSIGNLINKNVISPYEYLKKGQISKGIKKYKTIRKKNPENIVLKESRINALAYRLLNEKKFKAAFALFKLNIWMYPNSVNPYDSLAEAYFTKGDKKKAKKYYIKLLKVISKNSKTKKESYKQLKSNGIKMLKKLEKK